VLKFLYDDVFSGCYRDFSGKPSTTRLRFALDDIIKNRIFRREPHCNDFIFRESELPEGLKPVLFKMRYRASGESLVTNRNKLIELPAEALGGDCTNSLLRQLLKKNFYFLLKRSSSKLFLKTPSRKNNSRRRNYFLRRRFMLPRSFASLWMTNRFFVVKGVNAKTAIFLKKDSRSSYFY